MILWNYIVIGLGLVLLAVLLWRELRRPRRLRWTARVIATVLAVSALVCMGLPMSCRRGRDGLPGKEGVLLTEGYDVDSVRAFLRGHTGAKVIRYEDAKVISSDDLSMDRWHVFGYGLTKEEWTALRPPSLALHSSSVKTGMIAANWQRKLRKGEPLRVQGHWKGEGQVTLLLEGMGQVLDSAVVRGDSLFSLNTVPALVGKGIYKLVAVARKDTLEQENIPVEVAAGKPLKVLVLASSPDIENTFLVGWLSKEGHAVASRVLVSKDKYEQVYANMMERPLGQITPALLGDFDLVIADALTLSDGGILPMLRRQVGEKGLGLVIRVDSAGGAAMGMSAGGGIKEKPGMRVLLRDSTGRMEVGSSREGAGKIVLTNHTTYSMVLAGEQERYAAYWSLLLREAVRDVEVGDSWVWRPELPRVNLPVQFALQTGASGMPQGLVGAVGTGRPVNVYLAEDGVLPYCWEGRYWPEAVGWQTVSALQGDATWWYAWPAEAWRPLYREKRRRETELFIKGSRVLDKVLEAGGGVEQRASLSKDWFCALFFVSLGFLWIEKKIL